MNTSIGETVSIQIGAYYTIALLVIIARNTKKKLNSIHSRYRNIP